MWPKYVTKPVYRRRWRDLRGYVSPFTNRAGGSFKVGPLSITSGGRIYVWGARIR